MWRRGHRAGELASQHSCLCFYIRSLDTPTGTSTEHFPVRVSCWSEDCAVSADDRLALCSSCCVGVEDNGTAFDSDEGWEKMVVSCVPTRTKGFPEMPSSESGGLVGIVASESCLDMTCSPTRAPRDVDVTVLDLPRGWGALVDGSVRIACISAMTVRAIA